MNEPVDKSTSSMRGSTSDRLREGCCSEDRQGDAIEGGAQLCDCTIATSESLRRLQTVIEVMTSIHAGAEVVQIGLDHYWVTAPLEVIPRLVRARDCTLHPPCKVEFFEQAPLKHSLLRR